MRKEQNGNRIEWNGTECNATESIKQAYRMPTVNARYFRTKQNKNKSERNHIGNVCLILTVGPDIT